MIHGAQRRARHPSPRLAIMAVIMMTWLPAMVRPLDVHLSSSDSRGYAPYMEVGRHGLDQSPTLLGSTKTYVPHSTTMHLAGGKVTPRLHHMEIFAPTPHSHVTCRVLHTTVDR